MLKWLVIGMYALHIAYKAYLDHLRDVAARAKLPECVNDVYDENEYKRWQEYHTDHRKLNTIKTVVFAAINVILLAFNVYSLVFNALACGTIVKYILMALIFEGFSTIVYLPFDYYATFTIEAKYEMNKSTKRTFYADTVKSFAGSYLLMCVLMFIIMFAYEKFANVGILIACGGITLFMLIIQSCSFLFLRMFNKFTPLEEGSLRTRLTDLCEKYGATVKDISVMDMSRRTTKANAFCSGLGKRKRIALADNLIERYTEDQIVAVFAHEFGHARYRHIPKLLLGNIIRINVMILMYAIILNLPVLFEAFGFDGLNYYFLFTLELIFWPISEVFDVIINYFSRRYEYQADAMAAREGYGEDIISSLKQLHRDSLSDLNPHPFIILVSHNHPSLVQRIEAIRKINN